MKVLVADDEFYARKALVKMLNDIGLEVEVAADVETGKEAVEFLAGNPERVKRKLQIPSIWCWLYYMMTERSSV